MYISRKIARIVTSRHLAGVSRFRATALAMIATAVLGAGTGEAAVSKNVQLLAHFHNYLSYSACASYVHHDGREYAVLGTNSGTSIVNVTNPAASYEVGFIPGMTSVWREMKQYRNWIYVSTEAAGGGIQIIRMTDPENPVLAGTYTTAFNRAHSVTVDTTRALLILNGTRLDNTMTGMHIMSLANPESPADLGMYNLDYVHDSWMRGTRLHAFCIGSGTVRIFDTTNPASPVEQVAWVYPDSKSHSGETSKDGRYLFVCDEINYSTFKVFDIQDIFAHPMVYEKTVNPLAIVHNVHVKQDTAFVAWYTEGVRLFDVTDPTLPAEWGYYDTYAGFSGGYHGVWEVAPFFPSGTFIASDIETGLYVFRATRNYGVVKVRARDSGANPMPGVDIVRVGFTEDSTRTGPTGGARIALPPGPSTLRVSKFGYQVQELSVNVSVGSQDSVVVTMPAMSATTLSGTVRRAADGVALSNAEVSVIGTPLQGTSAASGAYSVPGTPEGIRQVRAYLPGFAPAERWTAVEPGVARSLDWRLVPAAWYDSCDTNKGWSLVDVGDNAVSGRWERAIPNGTTGLNAPAAPGIGARAAAVGDSRGGPLRGAQHDEPAEGMLTTGPIAPGEDATPGAGTGWCFVTGNGPPNSDPSSYDIDQGKTTLTTPPLNLTGMSEPTLSWQRWFHMNTPGEPDSLVIQITANGTLWVNVFSIRESHAHWHQDMVRVKDYITPSATVRVRFIAQDQGPSDGVVEAGVDDFQAYDAALTPTAVGDDAPTADGAPAVALEAPRPNPTVREASLTLRLRSPGRARVMVYDAAGRRIATLFDGDAPAGPLSLRWNGKDAGGRNVGSGIYWIRAEAAGELLSRRIVRLK